MKLIFTTVFLILVLIDGLKAQEKRNILIDKYTRKAVNATVTMDHSWINYPSYDDRDAWAKIPEGIKKHTIEAGEQFLGYDWPAITATMYLEFTRTGNRAAIDKPNSDRRRALQTLMLAELMEGKGRFLDDLLNGVFIVCEQTYWGSSAHFYLYGFDAAEGSINDPYTVFPNKDDLIIDLFAAEMAADLAWIWYFFHKEFDKISPVISKRIKDELQNKILDPYYERYDLWWISGWGEGDKMFDKHSWTMNNWTTWITYNMLNVILLLEEDPEKKVNGIYKTMVSINDFLNSYPGDGACMEGPEYWGHAGAKLFGYLSLLNSNTKGGIDVFDNELIRNIGRFIYRAYISKGVHYINFASAAPVIRQNPGVIFRFGKVIGDSTMKEFGAYLLKESNFGEKAVIGPIGATLENLFNLEGWQETRASEPLISEFYFPDSEVAFARDRSGTIDGFYFAAWGGDNGGGHNHNDVGSSIVFFNGGPVLIDVGRRATQTSMHNAPLINGIAQARGGKYKAVNSKYASSRAKVTFSTDISGAYPPEAKAKKWVRTYSLQRGNKITIEDDFQLTQNLGNTSLYFITGLPGRIVTPGVMELAGDGFLLHLKYNPSMLSASIEESVLGDEIARLVFDLKSNDLSENLMIEIVESK